MEWRWIEKKPKLVYKTNNAYMSFYERVLLWYTSKSANNEHFLFMSFQLHVI